MKIQKFFSSEGVLAALLLAATLAVSACSGGGTTAAAGCMGYGGGNNGGSSNNCGGHPAPSPSPSTAAAQTVVVRLAGENAATDPTYGNILGFQLGTSGSTSQVIHLTANTAVRFTNMDATLDHTASFVGPWMGSFARPFPASNLGPVASAAGTAISTANFSSGNLTHNGGSSAVFNTGGAATLIFGCAYHYDSNGMQTVVIVQ